MGFFERPDPRVLQSADPTPAAAVFGALRRDAIALAICLLAVAGAYAVYVAIALHATSATRGTIVASGLDAPATIVRDARDIPHIVASNDHDMYFAEGYAQGSDRLFQLDLTRRYAYGRLSEVFGTKTLDLDRAQRAVDVNAIAQRQLRALSRGDRAALAAFSAGINAAEATQPLPVEFRMLFFRPAPWTPKDSLAVSIVASLELADSWHAIFERDAAWREAGARCFNAAYPLSDARYDVTVDGTRAPRGEPSPQRDCLETATVAREPVRAIGSNAWAAGGARTHDGNALLANDPHLDLTIPGIWYVVDVRSPRQHSAGATIPGIPGVLLGHNENLAWASTNGEMATTGVFEAGRLSRGAWVTERFRVRFARDVYVRYYRTAREFSVQNENSRSEIALVRWPIYAETGSTIATALALDRARDVRQALRILAAYRGSPQNFILADRSGAVAYHVAGLVPNDPAWGRYVHPASALHETFAPIPFSSLPSRPPKRDAVLVSANNKAYDRTYPYRLSAQFEVPYRAYRIADLLRARTRYDDAYFATMQLDTFSPIDAEIARDVVRFARAHAGPWLRPQTLTMLGRWNGRYDPDSQGAALEHALRVSILEDGADLSARLAELRGDRELDARGIGDDLDGVLYNLDERPRWRDDGGMRIEHPLAPMNFAFLNGAWLPGSGDEYTVHLQEPGFAQGFRAVWDVGNWERGGIAIPSGESGEPGSGHYTDLTQAWISGALQPLPFGTAAVRAAATQTLTLRPPMR